MSAAVALPNPVFEGSEKRIEVHFAPRTDAADSTEGLRLLTRAQLDSLMRLAACEVVSHMANAHMDAYVLSESSLFVYPTTWILKTCGTTQLLSCLPELLRMAEALGLEVDGAKYSRASFLFPEEQPPLYQSFDHEVEFLRTQFANLPSAAHVLGNVAHGLQWHVFAASNHSKAAAASMLPTTAAYCEDSLGSSNESSSDYGDAMSDSASVRAEFDQLAAECMHGMRGTADAHTLEICMTDLDERAAQQFMRDESFVSSAYTSEVSGIRALVPAAAMDDYVFEPCGYSMNGILEDAFMTVHVTPEAGFSYASCEFHNFPLHVVQPADIVAAVAAIFRPVHLVVAHSCPAAAAASSAEGFVVDGYGNKSNSGQEVHGARMIRFSSLSLDTKVSRVGSSLSETCAAAIVSAPGSLGDGTRPGSSSSSTLCEDGTDSGGGDATKAEGVCTA